MSPLDLKHLNELYFCMLCLDLEILCQCCVSEAVQVMKLFDSQSQFACWQLCCRPSAFTKFADSSLKS